jgi:hypothetical protein
MSQRKCYVCPNQATPSRPVRSPKNERHLVSVEHCRLLTLTVPAGSRVGEEGGGSQQSSLVIRRQPISTTNESSKHHDIIKNIGSQKPTPVYVEMAMDRIWSF